MVVLYAHLIWIWTACLVRKSFRNTSSITCHAGLLFQDKNFLTGVIAGVVTLVALKLKDSGYERFTLVIQTNCIRLMHKVDQLVSLDYTSTSFPLSDVNAISSIITLLLWVEAANQTIKNVSHHPSNSCCTHAHWWKSVVKVINQLFITECTLRLSFGVRPSTKMKVCIVC